MKNIRITIPILLICILLVSCSGVPNELEQSNIHGDVEMIVEQRFQAKWDDDAEEWEAGDLLEWGNTEIIYDSDGLIEELTYFDNENEIVGHRVQEYDEEGRLAISEYYNEDDELTRTTETTEFTDFGLPAEAEIFDGDGELIETVSFEYEDDLYMTKMSIEPKGKRKKGKWKYKHDKNHHLIKRVYYEKDFSYGSKMAYVEWDDEGNWIERVEINTKDKSRATIVTREFTYR